MPITSRTGAVLLLLASFASACAPTDTPAEPEWTPLFNGTDLTGWTPKIRGSETGDDPYGTFRVEGGFLAVGYDGYDAFGDRFGHLFHEQPWSDYQLRIEYRFVGGQVEGGPGWAFKNSGVMIHAQPPETMTSDQDFPISVEVQFLGGDGENERPTANVCTPGTHIEMDGAVTEQHCINSTSVTVHDDRWVTIDVWARSDGSIVHAVDGDTVLAYAGPVVGGGVVSGHDPGAKQDGASLSGGYIALQSESHPIEFRRVDVRPLGDPPS